MAHVEVVIVGAGAAGNALAATLARGGKQVVILEGGPPRARGDLYSLQIWARRLKWGAASETGGTDPIAVTFNQGWGTGGAALHHHAVWLRLHPEDFAMRQRFGQGLDWPLPYEDLRPYYDRVQQDVGISGDAEAEVWRPSGDPYPMPPLQLFPQARLIARGFQQLDLRTAPLPLAINSQAYNGRAACLYNGWCDAGCPIDALVNLLAVYLPHALQAGRRILHRSYVTRVLVDAIGERATGVEYYDASGQRQVQTADVVILAAFAVQPPRILLNSATAQHPDGFPLARVTHAYGADDRTCFATGLARDQAIFKAAAAYEVWVSGRTTMHLMGGTIMGRTAADSVTNSYGQTHEIPNLFIAGPGLFPTSGAVNPTFTLHALSLRAADYLLDHWASVTAG